MQINRVYKALLTTKNTQSINDRKLFQPKCYSNKQRIYFYLHRHIIFADTSECVYIRVIHFFAKMKNEK